MRLIIQFSELEDFAFQDEDILVSTKYFLDKTTFEGKRYSIHQFDMPYQYLLDQLTQKANDVKNQYFGNSYLIDAFEGGFNSFYLHIYITCFYWKVAIDAVRKKYTITEVIISDAYNFNSFLPYYEAEGEVTRKLFYKSYDFIPNILYRYLKSENVNLTVIKHRRILSLKFRIFARRYLLLHVKVATLFFRKTSLFFSKKEKKNFKGISPKFIFLSRGIAQTEYMLPFILNNNDAILFVSDGYSSGNKNLEYCEKQEGLFFHETLNYLSLFNVMKEYFFLIKNLLGIILFRRNTPTRIAGLDFYFNSSLKEQIIDWFDKRLYVTCLQRYVEEIIPDRNILLVTGEMLTGYPLAIKKISNTLGIKCIQLQTTLIKYNIPQAKFVYCDKFLFKSYNDFIHFSKNKYLDKEKIDYWGNTDLVKPMIASHQIKSVVYFTQIYENDHEVKLVKFISKILKKRNIDLFIKLHPRDTKKKFIGLQNLKFIPPNKSISNFIHDFQLAIVRTSSISRFIVVEGIPIINCLTTKSTKNFRTDYLDRSYSGIVFNLSDIEDRIINYTTLLEDFIKFRKIYLQNEKDQDDLYKSLNTFLVKNRPFQL